jgi:hypothetical protein
MAEILNCLLKSGLFSKKWKKSVVIKITNKPGKIKESGNLVTNLSIINYIQTLNNVYLIFKIHLCIIYYSPLSIWL